MLKDAINPSTLRRILVIKLRHHGDVLLTSPVLSVLKNHAPEAEIDALVYRDTQDMLSGHPALTQLHTIDRQWKKLGPLRQLRAELGLFNQLRHRRYDLVITLTEHNRGAWLARLLRPRWSVAPAAFGRWFSRSFTHLYPALTGNRRHTVEIHLDALRRLGIQPGRDERRLDLYIAAKDSAQICERLKALGVAESYIVLHPTSRWMFKTWPVSRVAALVDTLQSRGETVVLTSAPDKHEMAVLADIQRQLSRPVVSLAGQLSLKQLGALIQGAKAFIGMDSVPMHIAAAVSTPCVALFGPTSNQEWGPWNPNARVIALEMACRPCLKDGCGGSKRSECLELIEENQVIEAFEQLMAGRQP